MDCNNNICFSFLNRIYGGVSMRIGNQMLKMKLGTLKDLTTDPTIKKKKKKLLSEKDLFKELGIDKVA